jgi:hypothetical protein
MAIISNYENYEISLHQKTDSVYIQFLDKQFYKIYSNNYLDTDILQFNMSLDIFYKVLLTVFKALIDDKKEVATIKINPSSRNIILNIHHKYYLEFKFELRLDLNTDNSLGAKDLCIKKLEQNIDTLRKEHNTLQKFIDEYMELTITNYFTNNSINDWYSIKINTPIIILNCVSTMNGQVIGLNSTCYMPIMNNNSMTFNSNFKMIKCHTLTLQSMASVSFNYSNLPLSLKKLIIYGDTTITYFSQMDLPNLEIIQLESSKITTIHSSISHLKSVKTIRITGCTAFQERDLLLTSGYKFESY